MWWSLTLKLAQLVWKLKVSSCLEKCEMVFGILMQCCISHLPLKSFVPLLVVVEPQLWWGLIWLCTIARRHASLPRNLLWASQNLGAGQDLGERRFNHVIYGWDGWGVAFGDLPRVESLIGGLAGNRWSAPKLRSHTFTLYSRKLSWCWSTVCKT